MDQTLKPEHLQLCRDSIPEEAVLESVVVGRDSKVSAFYTEYQGYWWGDCSSWCNVPELDNHYKPQGSTPLWIRGGEG